MKLKNSIRLSETSKILKTIAFAGYLFSAISCNIKSEKKIEDKQKINSNIKGDNKEIAKEDINEIIQSDFNKDVSRQIKADKKLKDLLNDYDFDDSYYCVGARMESLRADELPKKLLKLEEAKYIYKKLGEICKNSAKKVSLKYKTKILNFELNSAFDETGIRGYHSYSNELLYIYDLEKYISILEVIQKISEKTK